MLKQDPTQGQPEISPPEQQRDGGWLVIVADDWLGADLVDEDAGPWWTTGMFMLILAALRKEETVPLPSLS